MYYIAQGDGRYFADALRSLNDRVFFRYGDATEEANPNSSLRNIAGVTNRRKNVFGMMPHCRFGPWQRKRATYFSANLKGSSGLGSASIQHQGKN
ncbi:hypothetical protein GCM10028819_24840 [Spirosoma humi]